MIEEPHIEEDEQGVRVFITTRQIGKYTYCEKICARSWEEARETAEKFGATVDGELALEECATCGQRKQVKPESTDDSVLDADFIGQASSVEKTVKMDKEDRMKRRNFLKSIGLVLAALPLVSIAKVNEPERVYLRRGEILQDRVFTHDVKIWMEEDTAIMNCGFERVKVRLVMWNGGNPRKRRLMGCHFVHCEMKLLRIR